MKRKLTGFLLMMMVLTVFIRIETCFAVDTSQYNPKLRINEDGEMITLKGGTSTTVILSLENITKDLVAKNIVIEPIFNNIDDFPFEINSLNLRKTIPWISRNSSKEFKYDFDIPLNAKSRIYPIRFKINYENIYKDPFECVETIYVKIENENIEPLLGVKAINFEGEKLIAGQPCMVTFNIKNIGTFKAERIYCTLSGFKGEGLQLYNSMDTVIIDKLEKDQMSNVSYNLIPYEEMMSGSHELVLKMTYIDDYGKEYKEEDTIFLPVDGKDQNDGRVKIIVDNYDFGGDYVKAGQPFNLNMSFLNTSMSEKVDNIKMTLTSEGVFSPVGSSNSFYIQRIGPQERIEKNIVLKPKFDAEHKNYDLNVDIEYGENSEGDPYVTKETISIQVIQENRL